MFFQPNNNESFKFVLHINEIDSIIDDETLIKAISNGKKINKNLFSKPDALSLDYVLGDLVAFSNLEKYKKQDAYKLLKSIYNFNYLGNQGNEEAQLARIENEINQLASCVGPRSYWVYNSKINLIATKIDRNRDKGMIEEIHSLKKSMEIEKTGKGMISAGIFDLYAFYYDKIGDWKNCEKYALDALSCFPSDFNELYISSSVSFLLKSSYMLNDLDKFEKYKKLLSDNYITTINLSEHRPLFRINETMAKYYFQKGKLTNAISHQELALAFISFRFPKDSEQVKAVATDLRNMLKQNNEIQAMRNLEERYNLKPLP